METTRTSLIEQQLSHVQASFNSKGEFKSFLQSLKKVILDLMNNPFGGTYNIVNQNSEFFARELFRTPETRDFLMLLGYIEERDQFVYNASDENMSKLDDCLQIVENYINKQENHILCEINGNKMQYRLDRLRSPDDICERSTSKDRKCSSGLKELLLSKHMKKEQSDDNMVGTKRNISRSSDFAFNMNGYYHQSCSSNRDSNKDNRKNKKCFLRELFHKQDHDTKGWNSTGLNVKLI